MLAVVLVDELLNRIVAALREHNAVHVRKALQLRIVLHSGQVERGRGRRDGDRR